MKKRLILLILLSFGISALFAAPCGDVNSDGTINIVDALLTAQHYVGLNPSPFDQTVADVNGDDSVNIIDSLLMAQYYVGLISSFEGCLSTPEPMDPVTVFAVNCGGSAYTAADGTRYAADTGFSGGSAFDNGASVSGTSDSTLYSSERYGNSTYSAEVPNGQYRVTLHFSENYHTSTGIRIFNVEIEGTPAITNLDLYAEAGGKKAYVTENQVAVKDGQIDIKFVTVTENALVNAVKVEILSYAEPTATPDPNNTPTPTPNPDEPKLWVFLAFGQSNMVGGTITAADKIVPERFKLLAAATHSGRTVGQFYPAVPPLGDSGSGVSPADIFGRRMVEGLPANITVAIYNVSMPGQSILLFQPNVVMSEYLAEMKRLNSGFDGSWLGPRMAEYGGDLYKRMVELGKIAQEKGEFKGMILHQGEADWPDGIKGRWPGLLKNVYDNLVKDIGVDPAECPLLVGELLYGNQGGTLSHLNSEMIAKAPQVIPNAHIISAEGLPGKDAYHFTREGVETLGKRYADKMLELLGY
ncbi:MAG: hypothetical protein JXR70_11545 [Spirochaetales bacterium]|nr:hypothetical protein [Spirochaetales bacterium]